MTRETKVGLVVSGSFLCLVGVVLAYKLHEGDPTDVASSQTPVEEKVTEGPTGQPPEAPAPKAPTTAGAPNPLPANMNTGVMLTSVQGGENSTPPPPAPTTPAAEPTPLPSPVSAAPTVPVANNVQTTVPPTATPTPVEVALSQQISSSQPPLPAQPGADPVPVTAPATTAAEVTPLPPPPPVAEAVSPVPVPVTPSPAPPPVSPTVTEPTATATPTVTELNGNKPPTAEAQPAPPVAQNVSEARPPQAVPAPVPPTAEATPVQPVPSTTASVPSTTNNPPVSLQPPQAANPPASAATVRGVAGTSNIVPPSPPIPPAADDAPSDNRPRPIPPAPPGDQVAQAPVTPSPIRPIPPLVAAPAGSTPPIVVPGSQGAARPPLTTPQVESFDEETYRCRPGDTFAAISKEKYHTEKYADALLLFNQAHPMAAEGLHHTQPVLQAGQSVYIPPVSVLEKRYPNVLPNLTPLAPAPAALTSAPGAEHPPTAVPASGVGAATAGAANAAYRTYRVRSNAGEYMREVARRALRDSERWQDIYKLNPNVRPEFPVATGTVLRLPADAQVPAENLP
jgi:hypothetical protein